MNNRYSTVYRGDIFYAKLPSHSQKSSIQRGERPVIVVSGNGNCNSPNVTVVPLTSRKKKSLPVHVTVEGAGLRKPSTVLCEQVMSIDKSILIDKVGHFDAESQEMVKIGRALAIHFSLLATTCDKLTA